jgi:hypothetical protein
VFILPVPNTGDAKMAISCPVFFRTVDDQWVAGYELSRDGDSLGTYDALSYFDDSLSPGVEYVFTIAAVDPHGEKSEIASITVRTPVTLLDRIALLEQKIEELNEQLNSRSPAPVPETSQITSYVPGDDGDWQAGVLMPDPRFTINVNTAEDANGNGVCDDNDRCNGTVTDNLTGLIWLQDAGCTPAVTWAEAIAFANQLGSDAESSCDLSDQSTTGDWRVPNVRELISIVDFSEFPTFPGTNPFINVMTFEASGYPGSYWSSTTASSTTSDNDAAYTVSLAVGWLERWTKSAQNHLWAVR